MGNGPERFFKQCQKLFLNLLTNRSSPLTSAYFSVPTCIFVCKQCTRDSMVLYFRFPHLTVTKQKQNKNKLTQLLTQTNARRWERGNGKHCKLIPCSLTQQKSTLHLALQTVYLKKIKKNNACNLLSFLAFRTTKNGLVQRSRRDEMKTSDCI